MNEEHIFALMMDALDNEIDDKGSAELANYLADHPDLAQEWQAMQTIEVLLRETPPIPVPSNFTAQTLSRLPNPRYRRVFLTGSFFVLLLMGLLPVIGMVWAFTQVGDVSIVSAITQSFSELLRVGQIFASAVLASLTSVIRDQPIIWGWVLLMLASLGLWLGVYRQFVQQTQPIPVTLVNSTNR